MTNLQLSIRPQPLGIFPLPASYLVLPPVDAVADVQTALLQGHVPPEFPPSLRFYSLALQGAVDAAWAAIDDTTPEGRYNRFVLRSDPNQYAVLCHELAGELALLLDIVAYTLGYIDTPPDPGTAQDELRGFVLMTHAAHAIECAAPKKAVGLLEDAVAAARATSPLLAAQLLGTLAETQQRLNGPDAQTIQYYREAIRLLEHSGLVETKAQFVLSLGMAYQDMAHNQRGALLEAVKCYQDALRVFTRDAYPELYALAQNNLALAYLAMPLTEASDQLRMGIAVQALREALSIYTRDRYFEQWASTQLNLANALQYLPSAHPQDNLAEAVQLYEELLQTRDRVRDPLSYARLLANQGNALAHLGIFVHARPKLRDAEQIFTTYGDSSAAAAVREVMNEIERSTQTNTEHQSDGTLSTPAV